MNGGRSGTGYRRLSMNLLYQIRAKNEILSVSARYELNFEQQNTFFVIKDPICFAYPGIP